jgi:hypothetical protein
MLVTRNLDMKVQDLLARAGRYLGAGRCAEANALARVIREVEEARQRDREEGMTLQVAADRYGLTTRHLRRLVAVGDIPNRAQPAEGSPEVWPGDIEAWILAHKPRDGRRLRIVETAETEEQSEVKVTVVGQNAAEGGRHAA